jgi:putative endonuclease
MNELKAPERSECWRVYVVECADGTLYTGIATNVDARLARHNDGKGARYTRSRRPVRLLHVEEVPDRPAALRREHAIKRLTAEEKRELVAGSRRGRREPVP